MSKCISKAGFRNQAGGVTVQLLVLMVPVFFGLMGFAVDLGRLYVARGELFAAAQAMALSAASQLIGTDASTSTATDAMNRVVETTSGFGDQYDYGGLAIGQQTGIFNSTISDPTFWATAAEATGQGSAANPLGQVGGNQAKYVRIDISGEAPLIFWRFLSLGQEGKLSIAAEAAAGVSAPLCTICGNEPIAIAPLDATDTTNFGFTTNQRYTFGYPCTGPPAPAALAGEGSRVPYVILNRSNDQLQIYADDLQQLFRSGAQGVLPSTTSTQACFTVNVTEMVWASATQLPCNANNVQPAVTAFLCGAATRMDTSTEQGCTSIADVDTLNGLYQPDTDLTDLDDYTQYTGDTRRVLTVAIVDAVDATGNVAMTVLGFRQFLLEPVTNTQGINPADTNGRFAALYLGAPVPVKQGQFGSCGVTSGPGKVVLYR